MFKKELLVILNRQNVYILGGTIQDGQCLDIPLTNDPSFEGFTEQDLTANREATAAQNADTSTQSISPVFRVTPHITMLQHETLEIFNIYGYIYPKTKDLC